MVGVWRYGGVRVKLGLASCSGLEHIYLIGRMSMNDFEIMAKLGEGAYSSVYKVKRLVDESIYALKKVKLVNLSNREIHNAVN